jgi:glycosyltransferase involved in cell wall biosynthesis
MRNNKLLFITHDTSRTGAPMVLLHFLKWIQANKPEVIVDVLALKGGDLEEEFSSSCKSYYPYYSIIKPKELSFFQKVFLKLGLFKRHDNKEELLKELSNNNYSLVFANTIIAVPFASHLVSKNKNSRLIAHIHELNAIIRLVQPNFQNYTNTINQFIAPSILVKTNLINSWSIPKDKIDVVHECATVNKVENELSEGKKEQIFTVGASGTAHWRKGHDIFLQLARYIKSNYPETVIRFVWVGRLPLEEQTILEEDLRKLDLSETVQFTGEVKNPSVYFNDFDVFVMTSREDPFPLVCIEVGLLGKPIIAFKGATGTEEVVEKGGGGFVVPYLSIEAMSEKIINYYNDKKLKEAHGEINKLEFAKFLPNEICPQLFSVIQKNINN